MCEPFVYCIIRYACWTLFRKREGEREREREFFHPQVNNAGSTITSHCVLPYPASVLHNISLITSHSVLPYPASVLHIYLSSPPTVSCLTQPVFYIYISHHLPQCPALPSQCSTYISLITSHSVLPYPASVLHNIYLSSPPTVSCLTQPVFYIIYISHHLPQCPALPSQCSTYISLITSHSVLVTAIHSSVRMRCTGSGRSDTGGVPAYTAST